MFRKITLLLNAIILPMAALKNKMDGKTQICLYITLQRDRETIGWKSAGPFLTSLPQPKNLNVDWDNFCASDMKPVKDFAAYVQQYIEK